MLEILGQKRSVALSTESSHTYHISDRDLRECFDRRSEETVNDVFGNPSPICASIWPVLCKNVNPSKRMRGTDPHIVHPMQPMIESKYVSRLP